MIIFFFVGGGNTMFKDFNMFFKINNYSEFLAFKAVKTQHAYILFFILENKR